MRAVPSSPVHPRLSQLVRRLPECFVAERGRLQGRLRAIAAMDACHSRFGSELDRLEADVEASVRRRSRRLASIPTPTFPDELPISQRREEIAQAIRRHQVLVICGETGSGKTTQIPKICLAVGRGAEGLVGCTQPRRIAARSVAARVARELGTRAGAEPGALVGCTVRFDDRTGPDTLVRFMTDGILLAETQRDRMLRQYDTIIIDEAHERSLNIDFLLGYLRHLLPRRPDLKVIITSATIDPARFSAHFGGAPVIEVSGRTYPVELRWRPVEVGEEDEDRARQRAVLDAVEELVALDRERRGPARRDSGDILVFQTGEREISDTAEALRGRFAGAEALEFVPLFGRLGNEEQDRIYQPHDRRRVVLATNIAETSLTVPGIRYVVDPGLARISRFSARTKVQRLPIEPISQASADQRAGRCGRLESGVCIRLFSEEEHAARPRFTDPEILRTSLASVILQMKVLRLGPIEQFPFIDPPGPRAVAAGYDTLHEIGAVDAEGTITAVGREIARLPIDPRLGRMLVQAREEGCVPDMLVIAAALATQDPRVRPADKAGEADIAHAVLRDPSSDFLGILKLWDAWQGKLAEVQRGELTGGGLRRWCRDMFLSYLRLREWQDVHGQLVRLLKRAALEPSAASREPGGDGGGSGRSRRRRRRSRRP